MPDELLAEHGPVHPDVAAALADGARVRCRATWGLSTTGVAGPDPQYGIAPGTVYVAISGPAISGPASGASAGTETTTVTRHLELTGGRAAIRAGTAAAALELLAAVLDIG